MLSFSPLQSHLFDIDVPGKITFQESKTLTPGSSLTTFETRAFPLSRTLLDLLSVAQYPQSRFISLIPMYQVSVISPSKWSFFLWDTPAILLLFTFPCH